MMMVLGCIVHQHNPGLVMLAALLCVLGSWATARLFQRTLETHDLPRAGWYFLTALAAGVAIWCTHFVAMLGFHAGVPVSFDPILTTLSLLIAVIGSVISFFLASQRFRGAPVLGGALLGLVISAMHYTGMRAYRIDGLVSWDLHYVIASVVLSVLLSTLALHFALSRHRHAINQMAATFALAIAALHFTGMAAMHITPLSAVAHGAPQQFIGLALGIAGMALLVVLASLVSYLIDNHARSESVEHLRRMALSDTLTGLPNRVSFNEWLELEIAAADQLGHQLALIMIDLDRFKEINDLRGHHAGDEVLRVIGRRLRELVHQDSHEFIARLGGDEFVALCRTRDEQGVQHLLNRLNAALTRPIHVDDADLHPGASLGIALYPRDASDKELLVSNADLAMYRAKSNFSKRVCFYERGMDDLVRQRRSIAADLREAIALDQLSVHYQVQTSVANGNILGYEALLRWHHPIRGLISPSEFIPIAEESGIILQLGEWVLREACAAATRWHPPYKVAVNLSPTQFSTTNLPQLLQQVLRDTGLEPHRLELELTESTIFLDRKHALELLNAIKAMGVTIALDDFGTGYSSLDILRSFSFDRIKIDASFVKDAEHNLQTFSVIRAVLSLGKSLKIPVLAEGIETQSQFSMLSSEGCDEMQGFLLGRPAPLEQIVQSGQLEIDPLPLTS